METNRYHRMTRLRELNQHIQHLAQAAPGDAPYLSCYLDVSAGTAGCRQYLDTRVHELRKTLHGTVRANFEQALDPIEFHLAMHIDPMARGVALFSRGYKGGHFFQIMQFAIPVENWLTVTATPDIYPLVELKDNYDSYKVVLIRQDVVQILDVDLGTVSIRASAPNPVSMRTEAEHGDPAGGQALTTGLLYLTRLMERLMQSGGHCPIILAGDTALLDRLQTHLSRALHSRLAGILPLPSQCDLQTVLTASLQTFTTFEERQSQAVAHQVAQRLHHRSMAVAGPAASLSALQQGTVDTLVMTRHQPPPTGWACAHCGGMRPGQAVQDACPACGAKTVHPMDLRAQLVRLAARQNVAIEVVESDETLGYLGGVGCLLGRRGVERAQSSRRRSGRLRLAA